VDLKYGDTHTKLPLNTSNRLTEAIFSPPY